MNKTSPTKSVTHSKTAKRKTTATKSKSKRILSPEMQKNIASLVKSTRTGAETAKHKTMKFVMDAYKKLKNSSELARVLSSQHHSGAHQDSLKADMTHMGKLLKASKNDALHYCNHIVKKIESLKKSENPILKTGSATVGAMISELGKLENQVQDFMSVLIDDIKHSVHGAKKSATKKVTMKKKVAAKKVAPKKKTTVKKSVTKKKT
jgi:hypothetical protein